MEIPNIRLTKIVAQAFEIILAEIYGDNVEIVRGEADELLDEVSWEDIGLLTRQATVPVKIVIDEHRISILADVTIFLSLEDNKYYFNSGFITFEDTKGNEHFWLFHEDREGNMKVVQDTTSTKKPA